jgi:hypothetical protein
VPYCGALNEDRVSRLLAMMTGVHSNLVAGGYREAPACAPRGEPVLPTKRLCLPCIARKLSVENRLHNGGK